MRRFDDARQRVAYDVCRSGAELRNRVLRAAYEAGLAGKPCPNTTDPGSPGYAAWLAGKDVAKERTAQSAE